MIARKPTYGKDYAPGFIGFSKLHTAGGLVGQFSSAISWMETQEEVSAFEKALGETRPTAPSHVFVVEDDKTVMHAYAGGVQRSPISMFIDNPDLQLVFREPVNLDDTATKLILRGIEEILGHPYNYLGLVGRGLAILLPLHHWPWYMRRPLILNGVQRALGLKESYYCSAAAAHALKKDLQYAMTELFARVDESKIMPSTLFAEGPFKPLKLGA